MPEISANRVMVKPKSVSDIKGKLESVKDSAKPVRLESDIHPKHWDVITVDKKNEKEILEKLKVDDARAKEKP